MTNLVKSNQTLKFLSAVGLTEGACGQEVRELQEYLEALGYLNLGDKTSVTSKEGEQGAQDRIAVYDTFDEATVAALSHYQQFFNLPQTGQLDEKTLALMRRPRCGNPDILRTRQVTKERQLFSNPWGKDKLSFCVPSVPSSAQQPDMDTIEKCRDAFQRGFSIWGEEANIPIRFHLAATGETCDITISFGDTSCLPGGQADACTDCQPGSQESMVYLMGDTWSPIDPTPDGKVDIVAFACHEVGHALGLCRHSRNEEAIMYPIIPNGRRHLLNSGDDNDVDRIRSIYASALAGTTSNDDMLVGCVKGAVSQLVQEGLTSVNNAKAVRQDAETDWPGFFPRGIEYIHVEVKVGPDAAPIVSGVITIGGPNMPK